MRDSVCSCQGGLPFLGRFLLSFVFIVGGMGKIVDFSGAVLALKQVGVQQGSEVYIIIALVMEIVGGLLLLLGWHTRVGALILMIFLFPTTLLFHNFWDLYGSDASLQFSLFLKNLAIYGGLIFLLSYGAGSWSFDALFAEQNQL